MQVGDLVRKLWHSQSQYHGLIIKIEKRFDVTENTVTPEYAMKFIVQHLDGRKEEYWSHELELVSESR